MTGPEPEHDAGLFTLPNLVTVMHLGGIPLFLYLLFGAEDRAQQANATFETTYDKCIDEVKPIPGEAEAISQLRSDGIKVALTTGFSPATITYLGLATLD